MQQGIPTPPTRVRRSVIFVHEDFCSSFSENSLERVVTENLDPGVSPWDTALKNINPGQDLRGLVHLGKLVGAHTYDIVYLAIEGAANPKPLASEWFRCEATSKLNNYAAAVAARYNIS